MLISSFFIWWYGDGWKQVIKSIKSRAVTILADFSVKQLSKTLFAPWKKISGLPADNFDDKIRALVDNLFSRAIGFVVRSTVIMASILCLLVISFVTLLEIILWPLIPILVPTLLILGIVL